MKVVLLATGIRRLQKKYGTATGEKPLQWLPRLYGAFLFLQRYKNFI